MTAEQAAIILLQCICPLLAQSGHPKSLNQCPLLGVKRTLCEVASISARLLRFYVRELDYLGPLVDFASNEFGKITR